MPLIDCSMTAAAMLLFYSNTHSAQMHRGRRVGRVGSLAAAFAERSSSAHAQLQWRRGRRTRRVGSLTAALAERSSLAVPTIICSGSRPRRRQRCVRAEGAARSTRSASRASATLRKRARPQGHRGAVTPLTADIYSRAAVGVRAANARAALCVAVLQCHV